MKSKLRVVAGHGGRDTGTVAGDLIERDLNIASVLSFNDVALKDYTPRDVTVQVIPADDPRDGNATLLAKIKDANDAGPDQVLLEVHHNFSGTYRGEWASGALYKTGELVVFGGKTYRAKQDHRALVGPFADPTAAATATIWELAGSGAQLWYSQNAQATPGDETWLVLPHLARELGFLVGEPIPQLDSSRSRFGKLGILDDVSCTAILIEARNLAQVGDPVRWTYSVGTAIARAMGAYFAWPRIEKPSAETAIAGEAPQDPRALEAFMRQACPTAAVDVGELVRAYIAVGKTAGIRADVALAHVIYETGRLTYPGTAKADWNNFAGVGVTSSQAVQKFPTLLAGVKAHVYHLRFYDAEDHDGLADCSIDVDPRHDAYKKAEAPRGSGPHAKNAHRVRDLGGRWAPSVEYGLKVALVLDELNRFVAAWAPSADAGDKLERAKKIAAEAAAQIAAL